MNSKDSNIRRTLNVPTEHPSKQTENKQKLNGHSVSMSEMNLANLKSENIFQKSRLKQIKNRVKEQAAVVQTRYINHTRQASMKSR